MKNKLIYSIFDRETGVSTVTIETEYGLFTGTAKIHPEDIGKTSSFAGCDYAERRATIKYLKIKIKDLKAQRKGIETAYLNLSQMKNFDEKSEIARRLRKYIYRYTQNIKTIEDNITIIQEGILKTDKARNELLKRMTDIIDIKIEDDKSKEDKDIK